MKADQLADEARHGCVSLTESRRDTQGNSWQ
jgi:hypothetical protein